MEQLVAGVALQFVLVIVLITLLRGTGTFLAVAGLTLFGFAYRFLLVQGSIFRDSDLEFIGVFSLVLQFRLPGSFPGRMSHLRTYQFL